MNDYLRAIIAPIIVAVIVGLGTGYLGSQVALTSHAERIAAMNDRMQKYEMEANRVSDRVDGLRSLEIGMARLEVEVANMRSSTDRLTLQLERANRDLEPIRR